MKKLFLLTILLHLTFIVKAQTSLSLDSCRALALTNNKDLLISNEKISAAHYQRKAAFTNYLPNFSATGAYMRNQKEFSLLNNDQKAALSGLGTNLAGPIQQAATEIATAHPDLAPLISSLSGKLGAVLPALDQAGNSLVDALRTDTRNIYAGAITLTQPLYMGGKIRAYNKITKTRGAAKVSVISSEIDANLEEASVVCQIKNAFVIHPIGGKMEYVSSLQDTLELVRVNNKWLIRKDIPQQNGKQSHD